MLRFTISSFSVSLPSSPFRTGLDDGDDGTQWLQQCLTLDAVCTTAWVGSKRALKISPFSHTGEPKGCSSVKVLSIRPRRIELPTAVIRATAEPS